MLRNFTLCLGLLATILTAMEPAVAGRRNEQAAAREHSNAGREMKLKDIEARILPRMRGMEYLGPEYDASSQIYRLKFINRSRVIFVDVDARNGAILSQR